MASAAAQANDRSVDRRIAASAVWSRSRIAAFQCKTNQR
jgi:hypothetical protein